MTREGRAEVHLEIGSGFFRIPTRDVIYNITIIGASHDGGAVRVVEKIVEREKESEEKRLAGETPQPISPQLHLPEDSRELTGEDFYRQISNDIYQDIGKLAKSLSHTITEIPAEDRRKKRVELDQAGEKIEDAKSQLKDIVAMTENATMAIMDNVENVQNETDAVKELLSLLKNHKAFELEEPVEESPRAESENKGNDAIKALRGKIEGAMDLAMRIREEEAESKSAAPPVAEKKIRFLFDLDVIFQTIYELCTNETVKSHIATARQKRDEIFAKDRFIDMISDRVKSLVPDGDNFLTVPLADVFQSLGEACNDKGIKNLMSKMETNQATIFLDQFLPLEVPPTEEREEPTESATHGGGESGPGLGELQSLLGEALDALGDLERDKESASPVQIPDSLSFMAKEDKADIFGKIEHAFEKVSQISTNVEKILESLSFQDLSGQQIMKIIKLLSDFQVQLLGIIVSFGSQLKRKEEDAAISFEESKRLAQEDVDMYLARLGGPESDQKKVLEQDDVNRLLEDLGF